MSKDTGGSAFPHPQVNLGDAGFIFLPNSSGMTMRDWFAGQALAGLLSAYNVKYNHPAEERDMAILISKTAYALADTMIEKRKAS